MSGFTLSDQQEIAKELDEYTRDVIEMLWQLQDKARYEAWLSAVTRQRNELVLLCAEDEQNDEGSAALRSGASVAQMEEGSARK